MTNGQGQSNSNERLKDKRIIVRNLVYLCGLPPSLASKSLLTRVEALGQYGEIKNIIVTRDKAFKGLSGVRQRGESFSAYVTYSNDIEATMAILSCHKFRLGGYTVHASYGMTKYCSFFLGNKRCLNKECLFMHSVAGKDDVFSNRERGRKRLQKKNSPQALKNHLCMLRGFEIARHEKFLKSSEGIIKDCEGILEMKVWDKTRFPSAINILENVKNDFKAKFGKTIYCKNEKMKRFTPLKGKKKKKKNTFTSARKNSVISGSSRNVIAKW